MAKSGDSEVADSSWLKVAILKWLIPLADSSKIGHFLGESVIFWRPFLSPLWTLKI